MGRPLWIVATVLVAGLVVINGAVRSDAVPPGQPGVIAFASDRGGDFDIYTVDPSSGTVAVLFDTPEDERYPAWSPDGTKLAFIREKVTSPCSPSASCEELWVRAITTGAETRLAAGVVNGFMYTPAWSPDGTKIAYRTRDNVDPQGIYVVSSSGGIPTKLTSESVAELSPDWSPSGTELVFSKSGALYTVSASAVEGSPAPTALTLSGTVPNNAREPSWSPDGRIAFFGGTSSFDLSVLYVTNANGSGTQQLWDSGTATLANPTWASDGGKIALSVVASSGAKADLRIYDPCTGQVSTVAASAADDLDPTWRPSLPAPSTMPPACPSSSPTMTPPPSPTTTTSTPPPTTTTTPPPTTTMTTPPSPTTTSSTASSPPTSSSSVPPPTSPTVTSTSTSSSPPPSPPPGTVVSVTDDAYDPTPVRIGRGDTVVWSNGTSSTHEVVDATGLELFALTVDPSDFATTSFVAAGRYRYGSAIDPAMSGIVSVPVKGTLLDGSPTRIRVRWAAAQAPEGYAYDVQVKRPGGVWKLWKDDVTRVSASFKAVAGDGTYRFRARMVRLADAAHSRWSVADAVVVSP